jgi:tetratricopeptide (TPR) repeat protein
MSNERSRGSLPHRECEPPPRLRSGAPRLWRAAPNDASIPYTPPSSRKDAPGEHELREEVERWLLAGDFGAALRAVGARMAEGRFADTAMHLLGVVRLFQGDAASADDCLTQALALRAAIAESERAVSTRNALARVAMYLERYEQAWMQLDRALALDPISLHLHWNRLCLARDELARSGGKDAGARQRLAAAHRAMASIDPEWGDEAATNPFLVSLK